MLDSHIISALGWTLIHFLWQGSAIAFVYWLISRSSKSLHTKYWTGMVAVLLALLIPMSQFISLIQAPDVNQGTFFIANTVQTMAIKPLTAWETFLALTHQSLPYLVLIWAVVVMALTTDLVRSWFKLNAIEHDCEPTLSIELKQLIKNTAIQLDLASIPILKVSKKILVPAAYGIYKPTVLLPLSLMSQLPKDQIHAIIIHELCHLKRNDFLHNILQLTADTLFFFHPAIRWMNNDIRQIREQCCDQLVLSQNTHAITYAKALTNIASLTTGHNLKPSLQIGISDGQLLQRVKFLLQNNSSQSSIMIFLPLFALFLASLYLFQSNQAPLGHNDTPTTNQKQNQNTLKKRFVSNLFYPSQTKNKLAQIQQETTTPAEMPIQSKAPVIELKMLQDAVELGRPNSSMPLTPPFPGLQFNNTPPSTKTSTTSTERQAVNDIPEITSHNSTNEPPSAALIKPILSRYINPEYPAEFWRKQVEQTVIASFTIKANGKLDDIRLTSQINNYAAFEQSVKTTLRKWRFQKSSLNNANLQRTYQQLFEFKISEDVEKNCKNSITGTRLKRATTCNQ